MMYPLILLAALGAGAAAPDAWARSDPGDAPANAVVASKTGEPPAPRSPLWQAVEAQYRQRGPEPVGDDRRLTQDQRQELREQIRRGSAPVGAGERGSGTPAAPR